MSACPAVILPALLLKDSDRSGAALPYDFSGDLRALYERLSNDRTRLSMDEMHPIELNHGADIAGQFFDLNRRAGFNPILFSTCFNNCVHVSFSPHATESCNITVYEVSRASLELIFGHGQGR
jgi:hypothetical protein